MEYTILIHERVKPHLIVIGGIKELVKKDLINRGYKFIKETTLDAGPKGILLIEFTNAKKGSKEPKSIKNTPFTYYLEEFTDLTKAVNRTFNSGDRGGYCKLITETLALCMDAYTLSSIRDYIMWVERSRGVVEPYEEADDVTEANW